MTGPLFYIADPSDDTYMTKEIDFLEYVVGGSGFQVVDGVVDLGEMAVDQEFFHNPGADGAAIGSSAYYETEMSFSLLHTNTSVDNMVAAARALGQALRRGGTIVWQPEGQTDMELIDYFPSTIPQQYRGQDRAILKIVNLLKDPDGLPVRIKRHPFARLADTDAVTDAAIDNGVGNMHVAVTNPGTAPSEAKIAITIPNAGARTTQCRIGLRSQGNLTEFESLYSFNPTLENDGGTGWFRCWRQVITPADQTALMGSYRVLAETQADTAELYTFQLRWAMADVDPAGLANDYVFWDISDYQNGMPNPADLDLGVVTFDDTGSALTLELWCKSDGVLTQNVGNPAGTVVLMPADELYTIVSSPGMRHGRYDYEFTYGSEGTRNPTDLMVTENESVVIDQLHAYWESDARVLPQGTHIFRFAGHVRNPDATKAEIGQIQLFANGVQDTSEMTKLQGVKGHVVTGYDENPKGIVFVADGSSSYKVRVKQTIATGSGIHIRLHKMKRWFIPHVNNGRRMVVDAFMRRAYIADASGFRLYPLEHTAFVTLPPGDSVLVFRLGDSGDSGVFHDADAREPLAKIVDARAGTVTITVTPRHPS